MDNRDIPGVDSFWIDLRDLPLLLTEAARCQVQVPEVDMQMIVRFPRAVSAWIGLYLLGVGAIKVAAMI